MAEQLELFDSDQNMIIEKIELLLAVLKQETKITEETRFKNFAIRQDLIKQLKLLQI